VTANSSFSNSKQRCNQAKTQAQIFKNVRHKNYNETTENKQQTAITHKQSNTGIKTAKYHRVQARRLSTTVTF